MDAKDILGRLEKLRSTHSYWRGLWEDCARYCLPDARPVGTLAKLPEGSKKRQPNDTTGMESARSLASWLYSSTVYQGEQWFSLRAISKNGKPPSTTSAVAKFLEKLSSETLGLLATSNFAQTYQEMLIAYCVFGTGVFYTEFKDGKVRCRQYAVTEQVYIDENADGEVDTVFREFNMTLRQAVQAFGLDNLPASLRAAYARADELDKKHTFVHAVFPREKYDKTKTLPEEMPFASVYVYVEDKCVVLDGGTRTFPYCVPRFDKLCNEIYGRSPAMSALPVMRIIARATESFVRACEFTANPMMFVPSELTDKVEIEPGTVNPYDEGKGSGGVVIWSGGGNLQVANDFILDRQKRVEKLFYCDVFQYLEDRKNMTATEAQLRYDEMIQAVAPVLSRLHTEFFTRLIKRAAMLAIENGLVDASGVSEDGKSIPDFDIEYTTRLDTKIKGILTANIVNFVRMSAEVLGVVAQVPNADVYLATERIIRKFAEVNNVMEAALRDDDEIAAKQAAQAQQAQAQAIMQQTKPIDLQATPERGSQMDILQKGGML